MDAIDLNVVPFLPVDSTMSKPRNQGRQKLARFSTPELKSLVFDILIDTQRRQMLAEKGNNPPTWQHCLIPILGPNKTHLREYSPVSDDDPLYDAVAPDEDYATLPTIQETEKPPETPNSNVEELTKRLQQSDSTISDLKAEVHQLKAHLESLKTENTELKSRLSQVKVTENSINGDDFSSLQIISVSCVWRRWPWVSRNVVEWWYGVEAEQEESATVEYVRNARRLENAQLAAFKESD